MTFFPYTTVGDMAVQCPATVKVFQRRNVEFCCGGRQTLAEVSRDTGTSYEILAAELEEAIRHAPVHRTWADRPLSELTAHIVEAFVEPVLQELPRLRALIVRLHGHGDGHRRVLSAVDEALRRFETRFLARVTAEQAELVPFVGRLDASGFCDERSLRLLAALRSDAELFHQDAAQTIRLLRRITDGYKLPPNACATLRSLYRGLEEFERLMQLYVHLETNVLFSQAAALMCRAGVEKQT